MEYKAFQPEEFEMDSYSCSTTILTIFLSDDELSAIKHVHISLVVCHMGSKLAAQDRILPFLESIESDLVEVRRKHADRKDTGWVHS